jgi:hypothetical protein
MQETAWRSLRDADITLIAADSPDSFLDKTPTAVLIRQVLGAVSQFEKHPGPAGRYGPEPSFGGARRDARSGQSHEHHTIRRLGWAFVALWS